MFDRSARSIPAIFSVLLLFITLCCTEVTAQQEGTPPGGPIYTITALQSVIEGDTLSINIIGDSIPAFTVSELFAPFRVVINIAGAEFDDEVKLPSPLIKENSIGKMTMTKLEDQSPSVTRFELAVADTHDYKVNRDDNNINIVIAPTTQSSFVTPTTQASAETAITDFAVTSTPNQTIIVLEASGPIEDYKVADLAGGPDRPARMYIDVTDVSTTELVREKVIGTSIDRIRVAPRATGARIVFDSASQDIFSYQVLNTPAGLQVIVNETSSPVPGSGATPTSRGAVGDSTLDELIESSSNLLAQSDQKEKKGTPDAAASLQDSFAFSGYKNQRISVDFYKIDIHNVFRLFREITDLNIIVDEGVSGTVTLALDDVPWDFALDIILNLKNLRKEERYNTLVIYSKKKGFKWPKRAEDNLSFQADIEVVEQEALVIEQSANVPAEIMKAKELLRQAKAFDQREDFEEAVVLYEQAAELWTSNPAIYNRLATINLVNLGMNAKAVHYAKKNLQLAPSNSNAALYAAIGLANMDRKEEASEYFTQAISGNPPMKEALFSFAAFSENNNQNKAALKLLDKYHEHYGETVDTMLAKARIYDKLGLTEKANTQYKEIISSGFQLRPDLRQYIQGRLAGAGM